MGETSIQWTDKTWNPVRGCEVVSPGCVNCYAMKQAHRFSGPGRPYEGLTKIGGRGPIWTGTVRPVPEMLAEPLHWRKPARIFVNSMSDLFHEDVPDEYIAAVFGVMAACPQHTFQVLTKRAERMEGWFKWVRRGNGDTADWSSISCHVGASIALCVNHLAPDDPRALPFEPKMPWPLPNVWIGVSVENQEQADARIPHLLKAPAAVRFLSVEPMLEAINLRRAMCSCPWFEDAEKTRHLTGCPFFSIPERKPIHWVIVGGESGPQARPFHLDWARQIVGQCKAANVACFVKQLGACAGDPLNGIAGARLKVPDEAVALISRRLKDSHGGDPDEWPSDLRVRQFPEVPRG